MLRDHISFFTRLPMGKMGDLGKIGRTQYLFPLIGLFIGLLMYGATYVLIYLPFPTEIAAVMMMLFLYFLTGILHLDGLSDLIDGIYCSGSESDRVEAMLDPALGVAGALTVTLSLLLLYAEFKAILSLNKIIFPYFSFLEFVPNYSVFAILITAEVSGKLGMNTSVFFSKPMDKSAVKDFINESKAKNYAISVFTSLAIVFVLNPIFVIPLIAAQLIPLYLIRLCKENFGGSCGDMIGASNELTRITALLVIFLI